MQRRSTGLTMQLISPKSSFPIQDGKHSRQIEQMPQNNKIAASTNKLSVSLLQIDDADARSAQKTPAGVLFVRRGLFFVKRQRRCIVYLQKVLDTPITGNTITRHSTLDTRHSYNLTSFHNKNNVNNTFTSSLIHKNAQSGFFYPFACFFVYGQFVRVFRLFKAERYFCKGASV